MHRASSIAFNTCRTNEWRSSKERVKKYKDDVRRHLPSHRGSGWFQFLLMPCKHVSEASPIREYPGKHSNDTVIPTLKSVPITMPFRYGRGSGQLWSWQAGEIITPNKFRRNATLQGWIAKFMLLVKIKNDHIRH